MTLALSQKALCRMSNLTPGKSQQNEKKRLKKAN